jgi:hypothetical protein
MENLSETKSLLVWEYQSLRRAIGILGTALPFMISIGGWILFQTEIQASLSGYYYTGMRDVFVGALCAIGVFLLSYKGYERDDIAGNFACAFVVGVALFPTAPPGSVSSVVKIIGILHLSFAFLFLATLAYFSLCLFTKTDTEEGTPLPRRKLLRNRVYKFCGYTIAICILLMLIKVSLPEELKNSLEPYHPIYWLESTAIIVFGISWLTKSQAIFWDQT